MLAVQVLQSLCHSPAIADGAFVANLSVCYFLWAVNGLGRGASVMIFDAGSWLFDGWKLDRLRACLAACPTLSLQVSYKFQILVALIAWPKLRLQHVGNEKQCSG